MDDSPTSTELACEAIARGDIVGVPTDTLYGIAIDPFRRESYAALYAAKQRPDDKAIPILVADVEQAAEIVEISDIGLRLMASHWPGGLTLVLRRRRDVPVHIGDPVTGTVAVRAPDHPVALDVLTRCGPLAVTSANLSGGRPALDAAGARATLGDAVSVYLEGATAAGIASTVVDATGDELLVLRQGAIDIGAT
jgi:tRNA threonylcarbamoyl adenosine modification protein (Sua5/YciO/YrdC/YwlC family)